MPTNGPSARLSLTALLLCTIAIDWSHTLPQHNEHSWNRPHEGGQGELAESRFLSSDEEPGILLPPEDKYNFVGQEDSATTESVWRTGRSSPFPPTTIVSTNSYSIRPTKSDSSSSYAVKPNPLPMVSTGNSYTVKPSGGNYVPYSPKNSDKSTVFVKNNCFGPRCPEKKNDNGQYQDDDEWASYHYVMNKGVKQKQKELFNSSERPSRRNDNNEGSGFTQKMSLSIPFRVDSALSKYDTSYPNGNKLSRRVLRTTTPSTSSNPSSTTPGWVRLQPILPEHYDPFTLKSNKSYKGARPPSYVNSVNPNSQFSDRHGVELDPDSFADRWGWSDHSDKGSGTRFPAWLEGVNNAKRGSERDAENRNWVKLEPIPVAGVTISKWVPKGTPNSELPSTNWPSRDRVNANGNGIGHSNPNSDQQSTKWWDIIDNINRFQQSRPPPRDPPSYGNNLYDSPPRGWSPNKNTGVSSSSSYDRAPQNPWGDVIYPDGPGSATVSWQQDKDMSKYSSSFPLNLATSSSPWQSDLRRPSSTATGSWSADRYQNYPFDGNRRQGSSSYPDRQASEDDPRWVLVSNSRKVTVSSSDSHRNPTNTYENNKFRPPFDKFSDFPFYEPPYKNRRGKDYKDLIRVTNITVSKPGGGLDQEAAFSKINATLANLTPVLNRKTRYRGNKIDTTKSSSPLPSTSTAPSKMPAFLKPYFGDGRGINSNNADPLEAQASTTVSKRKRGINPVYAAVGAGMIPATMAAVLPMVLGRKRREVRIIRDNLLIENSSTELDSKTASQSLIRSPRSLPHFVHHRPQHLSSLFNSDPEILLPNTKHVRLRMR